MALPETPPTPTRENSGEKQDNSIISIEKAVANHFAKTFQVNIQESSPSNINYSPVQRILSFKVKRPDFQQLLGNTETELKRTRTKTTKEVLSSTK